MYLKGTVLAVYFGDLKAQVQQQIQAEIDTVNIIDFIFCDL
jgi:hypothetical protein